MKACLTWHADLGRLEVSDLAGPHAPLDGMLNWPAKPNWSRYIKKKRFSGSRIRPRVPNISNPVADAVMVAILTILKYGSN